MEITICYLLTYLIEAIIFITYCLGIFKTKSNLKINKYLIIFCAYMILFSLSFLKIMELNFVAFLIINVLLIFYIYESTIFIALFHSCIISIIMAICELIPATALMHSVYKFNTNLDYFRNSALLSVISKLLYLIIVISISLLLNKDKERVLPFNTGEVFLFIVPAFSAFITITFFFVSYNVTLPKYVDWLISISSFMLLIINICVFGFYNYSKTRQMNFYELQLQLQKESDINKYNKILLEHDENQRILIHDVKKHFEAISILNQENKCDKIDKYISHLLDSTILHEPVSVSDNHFLNALISRYITKSNDMNIAFYTDIRSKCLDFMTEDHITSLFCNLLDNSFESAEKVDNSFIELSIKNRENTMFTLITLVNSCISSPFSAKTGKLVTKKKNPFTHGFGVKSIEKIVDLYSGNMTMYYRDDDHTFHTIITLQHYVN